MSSGPKSAKRKSSHQWRFAFLGSASVKGAHEMLVKLTPGLCFLLLQFHKTSNILFKTSNGIKAMSHNREKYSMQSKTTYGNSKQNEQNFEAM
jgi:hypothetical protein